MGIIVYLTCQNEFFVSKSFPMHEVIALCSSMFLGVVVFALCSYILKSDELFSLWESFKKGKRRQWAWKNGIPLLYTIQFLKQKLGGVVCSGLKGAF